MFKTKLIISISIFVTFLIITSVIKNKTRILEKEITNLNLKILSKKNELNEAQLDFHYLSSPAEIEKKINLINLNNYQPISYSKIFFTISDFTELQNKISSLKNINEKKTEKNKNFNQRSFYFEDYLETNKKNKMFKKSNNFQDRIYLLFFFFFSLVLIFSIKITFISLDKKNIRNLEKQNTKFSLLRRDIVDRNGVIISRNINTFHAAIDPKLLKDKKKFLIKLRLHFPDLPIDKIQKKLEKNKYFRIKKRIDEVEKEKFWSLGEKAIKFEPFQARMYTHANLFSHIIGQVDYDNYGVSGVEKYFDRDLKNKDLIDKPLKLTLDSNIQFIINKELNNAIETFDATGGGALLIDVNNGDILSLISLPNFDINQRSTISDKKYLNKITKGVYELGSIFKTFTVALALEHKLVEKDTIIQNIQEK